MDADLLALAYTRAAVIPSMYSLLVVRHGHLVAEEYFDTQTRTTPMPVASVCKSVLSALVGIALDEGYLVSLDQRMIDFFPEYDVPALDLVVVTTADNFLGDFSNTPWFTESSIFRLIARDVIPAAY